jgi:phenylalanyl-tRNA synthetase beta chain
MDLAEDVAIAYGYENFEPEIPNVATIGEEDPLEIFKNRVADILAGLGFIETISYNLSNKETNNQKMLNAKDSEIVELANSVTIDRKILRSWLLPSIMQVFSDNTNREYPQLIFELGVSFKIKAGTETGVIEKEKLAIGICHGEADFTKAKQILETLANALDIKYSLEQSEHQSFIAGRAANIIVNKKNIGIIGEINPEVISNFGVQMPIAAIELDLEAMHDIIAKKI